MMGPMIVLGWFDISRPVSLVTVQFIGACLFWYIDKWIFTDSGTSKSEPNKNQT